MIAQNLVVNGSGRILNKLWVKDLEVTDSANFINDITAYSIRATNATITGTLTSDGTANMAVLNASGAVNFSATTIPTATADGGFNIGNKTETHISFGPDRIQTRTSIKEADLRINHNGGAVYLSNSGKIIANNGTFTAVTVKSDTVDTSALSATALAVTGNSTLNNVDVKGTMSVYKMENNIIQNIGGQLMVAPTYIPTTTGTKATIYCTAADASSVTFSILDTTAITGLTYAGANWYSGSKVKFHGRIKSNKVDNEYISFSSVDGTLTSNMNASNGRLVVKVQYIGAVNYFNSSTSVALAYEDFSVMMYEIKSGANYYPVGIYIKSYGSDNKNSYIDIYGGTRSKTTPNIRLGLLNGLKDPDAPANDMTINGVTATGWGLYADNVFLKANIIAKNGIIGGWQLYSTSLRSGQIGENGSLWLATDAVPEVKMAGSLSTTDDWRLTVGSNFGVLFDGTVYASNIYATGGSIGGCTFDEGILKVPAAQISGMLTAEQIQVGLGNNLVDVDETRSSDYNASIGEWTVSSISNIPYLKTTSRSSPMRLYLSAKKKCNFTSESKLEYSIHYLMNYSSQLSSAVYIRVYYYNVSGTEQSNYDTISDTFSGKSSDGVKTFAGTLTLSKCSSDYTYYRIALYTTSNDFKNYCYLKDIVVKEKVVQDVIAEIGGWTVGTNALHNGNIGAVESAYLTVADQSGNTTIAGATRNDWRFTIDSHFGVTKNGALYCDNLNLVGYTLKDLMNNSNLVQASENNTDATNSAIDSAWTKYTSSNITYIKLNTTNASINLSNINSCEDNGIKKGENIKINFDYIRYASTQYYTLTLRIQYYDSSKNKLNIYDDAYINIAGDYTTEKSISTSYTIQNITSSCVYYQIQFYHQSGFVYRTAFRNIYVGQSIDYSDISGTPDTSIYIAKDGTVGDTPGENTTGFNVSSSGLLTASNAKIYGTIFASSGEIGGCSINNNVLEVPAANITGMISADRLQVGQGANLVDVDESKGAAFNRNIDDNWRILDIKYGDNYIQALYPNNNQQTYLTNYKKCNFKTDTQLSIKFRYRRRGSVNQYSLQFVVQYYDSNKEQFSNTDQVIVTLSGTINTFSEINTSLKLSHANTNYTYYRLALNSSNAYFYNTDFKDLVVKEKETSDTIAEIGGWVIGSNLLYYNSPAPTSSSLILSPTGVASSTSVGGSSGSQNWAITAGTNFGVTLDGTMYCNNAHISGKINAGTDSKIGELTVGYSNVPCFYSGSRTNYNIGKEGICIESNGNFGVSGGLVGWRYWEGGTYSGKYHCMNWEGTDGMDFFISTADPDTAPNSEHFIKNVVKVFNVNAATGQVEAKGAVYSNGTRLTSDERKKNIMDMPTINLLKQLYMNIKPIMFKWKTDNITNDDRYHFGIGAQTTQEIIDKSGLSNLSIVEEQGDQLYANYTELQMLTIPVVQDHEYRIRALEEENEKLRKQIQLLMNGEA